MATQFENGLTLSQLAERNAELVEALEKAQQTEKTLKSRNCRLEGIITAAENRISELGKTIAEQDKRLINYAEISTRNAERAAELESEVKFPGVMRCNTCGFSRSHVIVTPGGMRAGKSTPERCPNGCGPLWHDTYRRQYDELYDAYKELESRTVKLPPTFWYEHADLSRDVPVLDKRLVKKMLREAGIKWEAE
ncbi:TPA: hypothetical protein MYM54_003351 [Klebsiella pneumoniae]|nr:hypothetical protein [Klebsiella pneumoniae]